MASNVDIRYTKVVYIKVMYNFAVHNFYLKLIRDSNIYLRFFIVNSKLCFLK